MSTIEEIGTFMRRETTAARAASESSSSGDGAAVPTPRPGA
jgi:hypothetical protein